MKDNVAWKDCDKSRETLIMRVEVSASRVYIYGCRDFI